MKLILSTFKLSSQFKSTGKVTIGSIDKWMSVKKGKRMNQGVGHGLEEPVQYEFLGPAKAIAWTKKIITEVEEIVNSKVARCLKNAVENLY